MDIKTMHEQPAENKNKQAMEKRKENTRAIIADRQRNNQAFGISSNADGAFGIRKSAKIIKDNALDVKDTVENLKGDIKDYVKNTRSSIQNAKDVKKMAVSDLKATVDYGKTGGNLIRAGIKKTAHEAAPPKIHMKNVIRKARIKELLQSSGNMNQMTENVCKAGINAITSTLQYIARCILKGCMLVVKKLLIIMGPVVGIFFLFAFLLLYCANGSRSGLRLNVPETGKLDGVRVDMQGIETNAWYTTKNPFHQSGYGMVPRKSSGKGNCTCYAWGRRAEITGEAPNLSTGNASAWYDYNRKNKIYQYGSVPKPGAVCCWKGGSDGSGHVAIVETVDADGSFTISESSWTRFFFRTRSGMTADHMDEGNLIFQGFIYLDAYESAPKSVQTTITEMKSEPKQEKGVS